MNRQGIIEGQWWRPERPEKKDHGRLTVSCNTVARLSILDPNPVGDFFQHESSSVFWGRSSEGQPITLLDCLFTRQTYKSHGWTRLWFISPICVVGAHFLRWEDIRLDTIKFNFDNLCSWFNKGDFQIDRGVDGKQFSCSYVVPEPVVVHVDDVHEVSILQGCHYHKQRRPVPQVNLEEYAFFVVRKKNGTFHYGELCQHLATLKDFVCLATGLPCAVQSISGRMAGESNENLEFHLAFDTYDLRSDDEKSPFMNLTFSDIENKTEHVFRNLYRSHERFADVYRIFLSSKNDRNVHLENEFLNYVAALEAYHRSAAPRERGIPNEDRRRVEEVLQSCPGQHREWLEQKLQHADEPSLRKRVTEIACEKGLFGDERVGLDDETIKEIVGLRNYLTHHDVGKRNRPGEIDYRKLILSMLRLKVLNYVCLLAEVGLTGEEIQAIMSRKNDLADTIKEIELNEKDEASVVMAKKQGAVKDEHLGAIGST